MRCYMNFKGEPIKSCIFCSFKGSDECYRHRCNIPERWLVYWTGCDIDQAIEAMCFNAANPTVTPLLYLQRSGFYQKKGKTKLSLVYRKKRRY
jgi:hypothetical protein